MAGAVLVTNLRKKTGTSNSKCLIYDPVAIARLILPLVHIKWAFFKIILVHIIHDLPINISVNGVIKDPLDMVCIRTRELIWPQEHTCSILPERDQVPDITEECVSEIGDKYKYVIYVEDTYSPI